MVDVGEEAVDRVRLGAVAAVELDGQRRELAAVQRLPGRDRGPARVERLLLALGQDVRLLLPGHPQPVPVRLELGGLEQRVGLGIVEREPLELDEEEEALEVGGPVARERREVVRLGVHRIGVLAGRGVEVDAGDVLRELVELVEQLAQPLRRRPSRPCRAAARRSRASGRAARPSRGAPARRPARDRSDSNGSRWR